MIIGTNVYLINDVNTVYIVFYLLRSYSITGSMMLCIHVSFQPKCVEFLFDF
jgi:hypothetical protein